MTEDDPRHGTNAGYAAFCRCQPCRDGHALYQMRRRKRRDILGERRETTTTGSIRRIRALMAIGWTRRHIADAAGVNERTIYTVERATVMYTSTAAALDVAFERLSGKDGPSAIARRIARRKGFAPPMAWLDIDDPDERPDAGWKPVRNRTAAELFAELDHLTSLGVSEYHAAKQLGVTVDAIEKARARAGRGAA